MRGRVRRACARERRAGAARSRSRTRCDDAHARLRTHAEAAVAHRVGDQSSVAPNSEYDAAVGAHVRGLLRASRARAAVRKLSPGAMVCANARTRGSRRDARRGRRRRRGAPARSRLRAAARRSAAAARAVHPVAQRRRTGAIPGFSVCVLPSGGRRALRFASAVLHPPRTQFAPMQLREGRPNFSSWSFGHGAGERGGERERSDQRSVPRPREQRRRRVGELARVQAATVTVRCAGYSVRGRGRLCRDARFHSANTAGARAARAPRRAPRCDPVPHPPARSERRHQVIYRRAHLLVPVELHQSPPRRSGSGPVEKLQEPLRSVPGRRPGTRPGARSPDTGEQAGAAAPRTAASRGR